MPYEVSVNDELELIHLVYSGVIDLNQRQQARTEVLKLINELKYHRALVDLREADIQMSESDVIKFANSFKKIDLPGNYRIAGVVTSTTHPDNTLEIIVALDGINLKYFLNTEEAINWLTAV